jgi:flagellar motor protein MotB
MKKFQTAIAVIALTGMCLASPAPSDGEAHHVKKSKKHHAAQAEPKKDQTAEQLRQLKESIDQQQAATQQLQQQLQQTQQQLQQTQQQLTSAQQEAQKADAKATEVETNSNLQVQKVQADLSDVKTTLNTTAQEVQKDTKKVDYLEHPATIAYKGIRITPGGFIELTGLYRSRATLSDQATPFNAIPLGHQVTNVNSGVNGGYNANLSEFGMTARDSRITLRGDADAGTTKLAAYYEMDFFGAAPTANLNQTSSYTPRIRQAWGRAKFANGWTITGGQMWNLITLNRKGTDSDNSNVWIPNIIEAQYSVGYDWGRFAELRISKTMGKNTTLALGIANPAYLNSGNTAAVSGLAATGNGLLGNSVATGACTSTLAVTTVTTTCTTSPNYSTNLAPDMILKLAFDSAKFGHFEVKGLSRLFRDRVVPTATTAGYDNVALGGGVGAGAIVPVVSKKVDFIAQGLWGKGIARYQDAGASSPDFVVRTNPTGDHGGDNNMQAAKAFSALAGFETHPTKKTEFDALFGDEYYYRSTYTVFNAAGAPVTAGFGNPAATNTGCAFETAAQAPTGVSTTCTGNNRNIWNAKVIAYYDLYRGPIGTLRYGAEADYVERATWSGNGSLPVGSAGISPKGNDHIGFLTMRYIFP